MQNTSKHHVLMVICYCRQWLPRDKLEPLGVDSEYDQQKLSDNRKPAIKKAVMNAYEKALRHQRKIDDGDDDDDSGSNK